jgi:uncharacterized protein GlcG (DUF336 family)
MLPGDVSPSSMSSRENPQDGSSSRRLPDATPSAPLSLAVDAAQTAITTCTDTASGVRVAVAVIDSAGVVRVAMSADGAAPGRVFLAARKALAAIEFKVPTSATTRQLVTDPALKTRVKPNMVVSAGAVPLIVAGQLLGAIGVAGGTAAQDERCAIAGAARILEKLK